MPINIKEPIIVPEKSFEKYWVCSINISAPSPTSEVSADVLLLPYNGTTGETYDAGITALHIAGIMEKASADPGGLFAKAMYFLLAAINEEKEAQDAQGAQ